MGSRVTATVKEKKYFVTMSWSDFQRFQKNRVSARRTGVRMGGGRDKTIGGVGKDTEGKTMAT